MRHNVNETRGATANLSIELTTRCNSACTYCFARAAMREESSLSPTLALACCDEGYESGYRHLHLTGGEPLLWQGLFDLLDRAFDRGYQSVFMNTNGLSLTKAVALRLSQYPGLALSVSLQGPEAVHDRMRGAAAYRQTARGIARALDAGLSLTIFTAIGKTLLARLPAFVMDLEEKFNGIDRLTLIQLIRVKNDVFDLGGELLAPQDFISLVRTVSALNLCGFTTDILNDPLVQVVGEMLQLPLVPHSHSLYRPGKLMVRANRDMTLAHSTPERFGRYRPGMIAHVLAADRYREAVAPDDIVCPACRYMDHCRKGGLLRPSAEDRDMPSAIPYCQRVLSCIDRSTMERTTDRSGAELRTGSRTHRQGGDYGRYS